MPYDTLKTRRRKTLRRLFGGAPAWGDTGPYGLTQAAQHLGYAQRALPFWHFYPIHYLNWSSIFDATLAANASLIEGSYALQGQAGGRLAVGERADFVALNAHPGAVPPEEIERLRVRMTVVGGEVVYAGE